MKMSAMSSSELGNNATIPPDTITSTTTITTTTADLASTELADQSNHSSKINDDIWMIFSMITYFLATNN